MTSPAQTVRIFGGYLSALAAVLIVAPNLLLEAFGIAPVTDVWIRVTGMLVGFLGFYYLRAAAAGLMVFAIVDAAAAIWTRQCLKSSGVN